MPTKVTSLALIKSGGYCSGDEGASALCVSEFSAESALANAMGLDRGCWGGLQWSRGEVTMPPIASDERVGTRCVEPRNGKVVLSMFL